MTRTAVTRFALVGVAALAAGAALACAQAGLGPRPVVEERPYRVPTASLGKLAVMPFYPAPELGRGLAPGSPLSAADAADTVGAYVTDALKSRGFAVVAPNDMLSAFVAQGRPVPRLDAREAGAVAAREFGATAVLLGKVYRYRDREGQAYGAQHPASVGYEVTLFDAQNGQRLWTSRFDETQQPLGANVFNAQRYPGGGTRWLTAAELARWGADGTAQALAAYR
jgi:TolB-like protein